MTRAVEARVEAPSGRAAALFLAVSVLWGVPYGLIAIALDEGFTAWTVAAGRVAVAALLLLALALPRARLGDLRGRGRFVVAVALLDVAAPFALVTLAERSISSSVAGVLVASTPLWVALLALRFAAPSGSAGRSWPASRWGSEASCSCSASAASAPTWPPAARWCWRRRSAMRPRA
jgi:EamA-like transporter family